MRGFTTTNKGIVNVLQNVVLVSKASIINSNGLKHKENSKNKFIATWDTGATNTMVSQKVVDQCQLISTGVTQVATAGGIVPANTYLIDLVLPDNMVMQNLNVTCGHLNNTDVLIGMDIMNQGDFSVSNFKGQTKFTFRIPSMEHSDYVKKQTIHAEAEPGRNKPCSCGSEKKYKNCCGKKI